MPQDLGVLLDLKLYLFSHHVYYISSQDLNIFGLIIYITSFSTVDRLFHLTWLDFKLNLTHLPRFTSPLMKRFSIYK
jgi:hypothetical protein